MQNLTFLCPVSFTQHSIFKVHLRFVVNQYFIPFYGQVIFHCIDRPYFIHYGYLGYFYLLAIINNTAMNIHLQVFLYCGKIQQQKFQHFNHILNVEFYTLSSLIIVQSSPPPISRNFLSSQTQTPPLINNSSLPSPKLLANTTLFSVSMNLTILGTSYKQSYNICPSVTGLFYLAQCLQDLSMLQHMSEFPPF